MVFGLVSGVDIALAWYGFCSSSRRWIELSGKRNSIEAGKIPQKKLQRIKTHEIYFRSIQLNSACDTKRACGRNNSEDRANAATSFD
jgi:hypothetical protein